MGLILALILAVALAVFAAVNANNEVTLQLLGGYSVSGVQVWWLMAGAGLLTAVVAWICGLRATRRFKQELRQRDREIGDLRQRLEQAHNSLQDYESRMHEFALNVVRMAHRQLPPTPEQTVQELVEPVVPPPTTTEPSPPPPASPEEQAASSESPPPEQPSAPAAADADKDDDEDYI